MSIGILRPFQSGLTHRWRQHTYLKCWSL